jgi:hypothetical protein
MMQDGGAKSAGRNWSGGGNMPVHSGWVTVVR